MSATLELAPAASPGAQRHGAGGGSPRPERVPLEALRFAAAIEVGEPGEATEEKNVPITITARSGQAAETPWWGRAVHDMAGMSTERDSIPIDYCHRDDEILGYADDFVAADAALTVSGELTLFEEDDRASEIISKRRRGVPYQASINFAPYGLVIEQVGEGASAEVNGFEFAGPGVIFRKWILRGVAICPYGADGDTDVELSASDRLVGLTYLQPQSKTHMSATATADPPVKKTDAEIAAEKKAADEKAAADKVAADKKAADEKVAADKAAADKQATDAAAIAVGATAMAAQGKRFMTAFGQQGAVWFAEGRSFEEAQTLFSAHAVETIKNLQADNAKLKTQLTALRGESPVTFEPEQKTDDARKTELASRFGENMGRIVAGIHLPGRN